MIARATSAAPTFFPPLHLQGNGGDYALVDGGIFVNNPAMAAYAEARCVYPGESDFYIVSVGTGDRDDRIRYEQAKGWGLLGWAREIVPVMMDSVSEAVDYELDAIVSPAAHRRLQPRIDIASPDMDDASAENISKLQRQAQQFINDKAAVIADIAATLKSGRGSNLPAMGRRLRLRPRWARRLRPGPAGRWLSLTSCPRRWVVLPSSASVGRTSHQASLRPLLEVCRIAVRRGCLHASAPM